MVKLRGKVDVLLRKGSDKTFILLGVERSGDSQGSAQRAFTCAIVRVFDSVVEVMLG